MTRADFVNAAKKCVSVTLVDKGGYIIEQKNLKGLSILQIIPLKNGDYKVIVEKRNATWH